VPITKLERIEMNLDRIIKGMDNIKPTEDQIHKIEGLRAYYKQVACIISVDKN
jgi:hypothetical protein